MDAALDCLFAFVFLHAMIDWPSPPVFYSIGVEYDRIAESNTILSNVSLVPLDMDLRGSVNIHYLEDISSRFRCYILWLLRSYVAGVHEGRRFDIACHKRRS